MKEDWFLKIQTLLCRSEKLFGHNSILGLMIPMSYGPSYTQSCSKVELTLILFLFSPISSYHKHSIPFKVWQLQLKNAKDFSNKSLNHLQRFKLFLCRTISSTKQAPKPEYERLFTWNDRCFASLLVMTKIWIEILVKKENDFITGLSSGVCICDSAKLESQHESPSPSQELLHKLFDWIPPQFSR